LLTLKKIAIMKPQDKKKEITIYFRFSISLLNTKEIYMQENIQNKNIPAIQPQPPENQIEIKKKNWIRITLFVLLGLALLVGAFYAGVKFSANKQPPNLTTNPTENQAPPTQSTSPTIPETNSLGKTTISFSNANGEIYLKSEITLIDPIVEYPNSKLRTIINIYSQDDRYEPHELTGLNPNDYKWITLATEVIDNNADDKSILVSDRLFSFKKIPNTDNFLFVVEWMRSGNKSTAGSWSPTKFERVLYMYDKNRVGQELKKIMTFNDKSFKYSFPKIGSFSPEGRFVSLDLFGCWNCGGHKPEKLLLDSQSFTTKNIGKVSQFSWTSNGNYEYKDYVVIACKEPQPGECAQDTNTLPLKTGKM